MSYCDLGIVNHVVRPLVIPAPTATTKNVPIISCIPKKRSKRRNANANGAFFHPDDQKHLSFIQTENLFLINSDAY